MPAIAPAWELSLTRGPDSLWVKVHRPEDDTADAASLVEEIWSLLERHFIYRLVLDLGDLPSLDRKTLGHLLTLQWRIRHHRGLMRVCGLTAENQAVLDENHMHDRFPQYDDIEQAVMGSWPRQPR